MPEAEPDPQQAQSPEDPLASLREHVLSAREAAERLVRDAQHTPSRGWEPLATEQAARASEEVGGLIEALRALRDVLPDDFREQLVDLLRKLLAVLRALIEVVIERIERASCS